MVILRYRPVRSHRCCNRKHKCDLRAWSGGFTLIEILIVAVILIVTAMTVIPLASSAASVQILSAANMIAADLEYAKSMAISRQQNYSVVFNPAGDCYDVRDASGTVVLHPVKKGFQYVVSFSSDSRLNKVDIVEVNFDSDPSYTITFDYLGSPYSGSGTTNALNNGVINLQAKGMTTTITVEPVTGFISISD